jgi:acyl carrier protein
VANSNFQALPEVTGEIVKTEQPMSSPTGCKLNAARDANSGLSPAVFHMNLVWIWIATTPNTIMAEENGLKNEIRKLLVENCMLQIAPEEIQDDQALFGPDSLGLDSVDALQLVVALDKNYGLKIPDPETAKRTLHSIRTMAEAVQNAKPA